MRCSSVQPPRLWQQSHKFPVHVNSVSAWPVTAGWRGKTFCISKQILTVCEDANLAWHLANVLKCMCCSCGCATVCDYGAFYRLVGHRLTLCLFLCRYTKTAKEWTTKYAMWWGRQESWWKTSLLVQILGFCFSCFHLFPPIFSFFFVLFLVIGAFFPRSFFHPRAHKKIVFSL